MSLPNYPASPSIGDTFTVGIVTFRWDGDKWKSLAPANHEARLVDLEEYHAGDIRNFAIGDGSDETTQVSTWLDYLIANNVEGIANDNTFLINTISKVVASGVTLRGNATFKATGSSRLNMLSLTGATGAVVIDGPTFDGNNTVARPFEIKNNTSLTKGTVNIKDGTRFINAKNVSPATENASGCRIQGSFSDVVFDGMIDGVDNSLVTGAVSVGLWVDWTTIYFVDRTIIGPNSKIKNVKNDNTILGDADGVQCLAPTTEESTLTVSSGAYFENNKGRQIKSQVTNNTISDPFIKRTAYDGLVEIDLQYSGGTVRGAKIIHDGVRVDSVIGVTVRDTPDNPECTIKGNRLTIVSAGATDTREMVAISAASDTARLQGVNVDDNKVIGGTVDYMARVRIPDIADNLVNFNGNWAETINTAFIGTFRYDAGTPHLNVNAANNSCANIPPSAVELSTTTVGPITWSGNLNIPDYRAALFAYASTTLTNLTGDGTTANILFDTVRDDFTNGYNAGNGTWTAPVDGDYRLTIQLALLGILAANDDCRLVMSHPSGQLNVLVDLNPFPIVTSGGRLVIKGSAIVNAAKGDLVRAQLIISGGTLVVDVEAIEQSSFISIEKI
ncbi:MAG: hypothetical protein KUG64_10170 [Cycloclasticus sp.]|nr:hypothetical protein [Cycloclasticus sp.]